MTEEEYSPVLARYVSHTLRVLSGRHRSVMRVEPRIISSLDEVILFFIASILAKGLVVVGFIKNVKNEIRVIRERDPAIHSNMEVFLYPSFKVMMSYRVAHKLYLKGHYFWARWVSQKAARKTGI